jgi:hypothetical protein
MSLIIVLSFLTFLILLAAYLAVDFLPSNRFGGEAQARQLTEKIGKISSQVWGFGRPIVQLLVILAILGVILERFNLDIRALTASADVRAVLAVGVVLAFSLAALSGSEGASLLKDVALVVVGFYFGTLDAKSLPKAIETPKISQVREAIATPSATYGSLVPTPFCVEGNNINQASEAVKSVPNSRSIACVDADALTRRTRPNYLWASSNREAQTANPRFHRTAGFTVRAVKR